MTCWSCSFFYQHSEDHWLFGGMEEFSKVFFLPVTGSCCWTVSVSFHNIFVFASVRPPWLPQKLSHTPTKPKLNRLNWLGSEASFKVTNYSGPRVSRSLQMFPFLTTEMQACPSLCQNVLLSKWTYWWKYYTCTIQARLPPSTKWFFKQFFWKCFRANELFSTSLLSMSNPECENKHTWRRSHQIGWQPHEPWPNIICFLRVYFLSAAMIFWRWQTHDTASIHFTWGKASL